MNTTTRHHATRTFQGKIACAGSHEPTKADGRSCSVCGRDDITVTVAGNIATHVHLLDLKARRYGHGGPTKAEIERARHQKLVDAAVAEAEAVLDAVDTPANVALVAAFAANPSSETFQPMVEAMRRVSDRFGLYGDLARRHGIELPR